MDVKIDMLLADSSGSIGKRTSETKALNSELTKTQKLAKSAYAGQGGSTPSGADLETYNKVRGTVGTGADARDFANQAQGLGGVVRLYATFAANIFAVSAAFQNLQQAANFERLIQASKLMSEKTGTDMLRLGKSLQEAAGYAISFEDAMQFANLGTSAGIAAKQMTSLVEIAKGAAVGLGRDVNDAVRRIIQGTAKQEQEILDELGIFIKAKKAYDDYAKKFQIEGGGDALSAQQRVAAYANAVEEAGSKWKEFAKLDDPFSRFVATGKEAIFTILTFINEGIKPLISFLAGSKDAIIALSLAISGLLLKRALPELKNIVLDFFTFNSARAKAQATEFRLNIAREMAQISNSIQAEQAKLAALAANTQKITMAAVAGTLPQGMLAQVNAAGRAKGPGISPVKLEKQIFGAKGDLDLSTYKKVGDLEEKYKRAIDETIAKNQVKLDQMIKLGALQATSTLNELKLGDAIKKSAAEVFKVIELRRAGLISEEQARERILALSTKQAQLDSQFQATTPGQIQRVGRRYGPTNPPPTVGGTQAGGVAMAAAGAFMSAAIPATKGFSQGLGQASREAERLQGVVGGGLKVQLQSLSDVLADQMQILKNGGTAGAKFGAAIGMMGTVVGAAFRGIMVAFGPLMIIWTLWELFGDKIIPKAVKEARELDQKMEDLATTFGVTGVAIQGVNKALNNDNITFQEYSKNLDIASNAIKSQIDALNELKKKKEEIDSRTALEKAQKEYEARGEVFDKIIYNLDQTIALAQSLGRVDEKNLQTLKDTREEYARLLKLQQQQGPKGPVMSGPLGGPVFTPAIRGDITQQQLRDVVLKSLGATAAVQVPIEQDKAAVAKITSAGERVDKALEDYKKRLKGITSASDLATNEISRSYAELFDASSKIVRDGLLKTDPAAAAGAADKLIDKLKELAPTSAIAKKALEELDRAEAGLGTKVPGLMAMQILGQFFIPLIKELSEKTKKYTDQVSKSFVDAQKVIDDYAVSIIRIDMEMSKTTAMNKLLQDMRGYSLETEIAIEKTNQINKATAEFEKELKQIALELAKVTKIQKEARGQNWQEEVAAAEERADAARALARENYENKLLTIDITNENTRLGNELQKISMKYADIGRKLDIQFAKTAAILKIEQTRFSLLKELGAYSPTQLAAQEEIVQRKEINSQYDKAIAQSNKVKDQEFDRLEAQYKFLGKTAAAEDALIEGQRTALNIQRDANETARIERDTALEVLRITTIKNTALAKLAEETEKINRAEALKDITNDTELQLLNIRKEELSLALSLGNVTQDVYDKEFTALERSIRQKEYRNKLDKIELEFNKKQLEIDTKERTAISIVGPEGAGQVQEQYNKERANERDLRDKKLQGAKLVYDSNELLRAQMDSMSTQQKSLAKIYQDTFSSMGDAIVELVGKGKSGFRDLVNSMLASIARLYMNQLFMNLFQGIKDKGWLPGLGSTMLKPDSTLPDFRRAKGAAYDRGIEYYAKGGAFTNSIVTSPTMFKFAKGTGLMGEAGPEAIMPLKRDSQGNLGVRGGGGGKVEVVVNNYSTEKAQTRESTDSRGNRRVEVVIGDMAAGEISRSGSSSNRAIQGTFGIQPQLIRR